MASLVPCPERFEYFSSFIKYICRHILACEYRTEEAKKKLTISTFNYFKV